MAIVGTLFIDSELIADSFLDEGLIDKKTWLAFLSDLEAKT